LRIDRKRAPERLQIKDPLVAGFSVTPEGPGEFFGFSLDADHLYVDGNFTVHHNSGKTQIFCEVARRLQPERSLILCHREELIDQAARRLASFGIAAEVEMADRLASLDAPAVVGSVQTLMRDDRLKRWPRGHFGLVVADEAHHATSDSWQKVLGYFDTRTLGASATPERSDKRELGRYFENIAYEVGLLDLVKQGWLSPIRVRTVPLGLDLRGARTVGGDYNAEDLGDIIAPELGKIVEVLRSEYRHRKTIVFLPLVSLSRLFAKLCQEAGLTAWHVDGTSKDRADMLSEFSSARCGILSNAMLLTEGYDEPSIDCVVCLRPTKIRSLYCQIVGRGTRVYPNKDHLLLLDFLWLTADHALIKPAHLVAKDNHEAEAVTRLLKDQEDLETAVESAAEVRTRNLSERLEVNRARTPRFFDPLEFAVSLRDLELAEFEPTMPWHGDRVTIKQIKMLSRYGIDHRNVATKGHAAAILDRIFTRSRLRLATPKQLIWLRKLSHPAPELASFEEATRFLEGKFAKRSPEAVAA
jgi:superfamily II DNA or RNA helicase